MPIGLRQGGFIFTEASIRMSAPAASGVYVIYDAQGKYIYFGESNDVQRRLLEHLNDAGTCIKRNGPANFAFEVVAANLRVSRQDALIRAYPTPCNARLG